MKIEVSAKTIEKAIEDGLKQLNTTIENVDVKVISEGGMFKKAKIEMTLSEDNNELAIEKAEEAYNGSVIKNNVYYYTFKGFIKLLNNK